jgi:hypothetical protein
MAVPTIVYYTGDGSTTDFNFSFDYIDADHVKADYYGAGPGVSYTLISQNTVRFSSAPPAGVAVKIYRETPGDPLVVWADGAVILGANLNKATEQPTMLAEEARDLAKDGFFLDASRAYWNANSKRIAFVATPTAGTDAANKNYVDNQLVVLTSAALTAATAAAEAARDAANSYMDAAEISATSASGSASAAAASASTAESHKNAAAASAAAAATSASNAAASVVAAASSFDAFDDRYLGQKASDPTLDNDGNALVVGALYFNTTIGKMKVWSGVGWQLAYNDVAAASAITNDSAVSGATVAAALNTLQSVDATKVDQNITLLNNTDLDTVLTGGLYRLSGTHANIPNAGAAYGQMIVSRGQDTISQIVLDYPGTSMWFRSGNPASISGGGAWNAWRSVYHTGNFNPANYAALSGATFTGSVGFAAGGVGRIVSVPGNASQVGYLEWRKADNTRIGYMGWNNTNLGIYTEGGAVLLWNDATVLTTGFYVNAAQIRANSFEGPTTPTNLWSAMDFVTLTDAATIAVDLSTMINAKVTLGGNRTLGNPTNVKPGQSGVILIRQDGTGSRTLAFGANWRFPNAVAPTLSTAAGYCDKLFYFVESSSFIHAELVKDSR